MNLSAALPNRWHHVHLSTTSSTMEAIRLLHEPGNGVEFELLTADFQTAGRGQRGTSWEADAGCNLTFSVRWRPTFLEARRNFLLSEAMALAVAHALGEHAAEGISVKWPNDIYYKDKKICGMLLEHDLCGRNIATTVAGVGVNVNQPRFHNDAPNPISLLQIMGHETDRNALLLNILQRFEQNYRQIAGGGGNALHSTYMACLYRRQGLHPYRDAQGGFMARIAAVEQSGQLVLEDAQGRLRHYAFKEVAFG